MPTGIAEAYEYLGFLERRILRNWDVSRDDHLDSSRPGLVRAGCVWTLFGTTCPLRRGVLCRLTPFGESVRAYAIAVTALERAE
jgi:hypothetical protein